MPNNNNQSIEDLMSKGDNDSSKPADDKSPQTKLKTKSKEIKIKEVEKFTQEKAKEEGYQYIDLSGFPISPEALSKISE